MKFSFDSIQTKIGAVLVTLLLVNVVAVIATFLTLSKQETDSVYVDVAGRQRMLSQKMTKEALLLAADQESHWKQGLGKTAGLFEKSLFALRDGNAEMGLAPTTDKQVLKELDKLLAVWKDFKIRVDRVLSLSTDSPEGKAALKYMVTNNIGLLKQANEVTQAYKRMAIKSVSRLKVFQVIMLCVSVLIFAVSAWMVHAQVLRPLDRLLPVIDRISHGDLMTKARLKVKGELGRLAGAINGMSDKLHKMVLEIKEDSGEIKDSSKELDKVSTEVFDGTVKMSEIAQEVASAAENVDDKIMSVTRASQELTEATTEIAQSVAHTASITNDAQGKASGANEVIQKLGKSSEKIGSIIQVINTIAEQTNLLALNATIEAARAGEAGKGFAVVANEIKELARQTGEATEEITNMIETIQSETNVAVESVEEITNIVGQINDLANTIASAAEEQTATVSEITTNMQEASNEVKGVKERSTETAELAKLVSETAQKTADCSSELGKLADNLEDMVRTFKTG